VNAAGRPIDATTTADLANLTLQAGVYSGPSKGALSLTGPLTLDGAGNPNSVFIFQTDSTLITAAASTVTLINGASECNVFWQVGSSATLGAGSVFVGNILALESITLTNSVTVHGRALARNGVVTLDTDTFTPSTCGQTTPLAVSYPAGEGVVGTAFSLSPVVQGASDTVSFRVASGTLPAGLTLDTATGVISGTPTEAVTGTVTVEATTTAGSVQAQVTIHIVEIPLPENVTNLPATGPASAGTEAVIGMLVVLAGITFLVASRRHRKAA
jgi:LPXTG-motif cell wall-anchored protein